MLAAEIIQAGNTLSFHHLGIVAAANSPVAATLEPLTGHWSHWTLPFALPLVNGVADRARQREKRVIQTQEQPSHSYFQDASSGQLTA